MSNDVSNQVSHSDGHADTAAEEESRDELEMDVLAVYTTADGALHWGPRFDLTSEVYGSDVGWSVTERNHRFQCIGGESVEHHLVSRESLICLAARAAEELWSYQSEWEQDGPEVSWLLIEVRYGEEIAVRIEACVQSGNWSCEAWSFSDHMRAVLDLVPPPGRIEVSQLVMRILRLLAFAGPTPPPLRMSDPKRALPLPWEYASEIPPMDSPLRASYSDYWGGYTDLFEFFDQELRRVR
ncbi:hypothetical protein [Mitsuaria sp. PDC51]|uniref:hypothetical protein n=1 Tax=Mitsuaria sp. PDC51 TaxID=1881035 RepID=UPI0011402461|nr:hypothetical protein [Mitsuaria sp. PDC51]